MKSDSKDMDVRVFADYGELERQPFFSLVREWLEQHPEGNFFQNIDFFRAGQGIRGFLPFLAVAAGEGGAVDGSLMGVLQSNGKGVTAWFSRRIIVWGGPLLAAGRPDRRQDTARQLLQALQRYARGRAIFIEFRNFFDTTELSDVFREFGYSYRPHLNYLVRTDGEEAVMKRMSSSRRRQLRAGLKNGAVLSLATQEEELRDWYKILADLYREKVKKPLPGFDFFHHFWKSGLVRAFLVKQQGTVIGGIFCPVHHNKAIYEWYVCGLDQDQKKLYPSVLATWAPIDYALRNSIEQFDFMGAGSPDQDYGVREFKARFGGKEVCHGRYFLVVNKSFYGIARAGLALYQRMKS